MYGPAQVFLSLFPQFLRPSRSSFLTTSTADGFLILSGQTAFPLPGHPSIFPRQAIPAASARSKQTHFQPCHQPKGAPMTEAAPQSGMNENSTCGLAYLTAIPAIIFLVSAPYNQNANVRFHSWQSIFLCIAWFILWICLVIIGVIPFLNFLDIILFPVLGIGMFILWLVLMINAFNGKRINIPFLSDFAAKQAGV
jgi:uncharacterized membrane protein